MGAVIDPGDDADGFLGVCDEVAATVTLSGANFGGNTGFAETREDLERLTVELREETGVTTVVVTHNIEEAVYLGQRLLVLRQPPHREAVIIENPAAGQLGYRHHASFQEHWNLVRDMLREPAGTGHAEA